MGKYVLAYRGGEGMPEGGPTEEEMGKWFAWFAELGESVIDGGNPFAQSTTIGGAAPAQGLGGYSVISADSLDDAATKAKGCPVLGNGGSIDIYEAIEI